jgi:cell division protease FtsH
MTPGGDPVQKISIIPRSAGASDDLEKDSGIVREMLTVYGMSERAPNLSLVAHRGPGYLTGGVEQASHSEELSQALDAEILALLGRCYEEARGVLVRKRDRLEALAKRLLEVEELDREAVAALLGARPTSAPWPDRAASRATESRS